MEFLDYHNQKIFYKKIGRGPPLILLHNGGGTHRIWDYQIEFFKDRFTIYSFDLYGFGDSSDPEHQCRIDSHVEYLTNFIQAKQLTNISIMGVCMGASIATKLANQLPEKFDHMFLFNICPGRRFIKYSALQNIYLKLIKAESVRSLFINFFKLVSPVYLPLHPFPRLLFGPSIDKKTSYYQYLQKKYLEVDHALARLKMYFNIDDFTVEDFIQENKIPNTYIMWGEKNVIVPITEGRHINNILKAKEFIPIENGGHLVMGEYPEIVNRLLNERIQANYMKES